MPINSLPLKGQTAIVTGSGQNLGRGIALTFARAGANVVVNGHRNQAAIDAVAAEAEKEGVQAMAVLADVTNPDEVQTLVDKTMQQFGRVDIAVSNVGMRLHQPFLDITVDDWHKVMNASLNSAFYMARSVLPLMKQQRHGRLIHISGRDGFFTLPNRAHNVTAKAGMHSLAKAIALEFGPFGITANTVAPGLMDTTRDLTQYPDWARVSEQRRQQIPMRRFGTGEDMGEACLYLAAGGSYVSGQLIQVCGAEFLY